MQVGIKGQNNVTLQSQSSKVGGICQEKSEKAMQLRQPFYHLCSI
jgi:hypothetical protein